MPTGELPDRDVTPFAELTSVITRDWLVQNSPEDIVAYTNDFGMARDLVSEMAMSLSLCPVHFIDWAICFDDEDPECGQVRAIFPQSHDT
jgi:hypothetical protein